MSNALPQRLLGFLLLLVAVLACPRTAPAAGLLAPTDQTLPPLRVTDHLVDARIVDGVAVTSVTQTFRNDTNRRLEATYVFPLPEEADLTDFQMSFNGKMVKGRVLPAEEAARVYESIVRQAKDPGLIEFIGRRLLKMRVFPIEPQSDTTIQLRYQQICQPVSGMKAFHYPLRTRTTAGQAYGTVRFAVSLNTSVPLKSIWSPTHAVEIVRAADEKSATVAYEATGGSLEDDFLMLYDTDGSDVGLSVVAHQPETGKPGHFVLMLTPRQLWPETKPEPQDVVFVLDTSGSMAGAKLEQARTALKFCIDRLEEQDRFSVVRFSTGYDVLFQAPVAATEANRAKARAWIDDFRSAGGTNIADTLQHVLSMRPDEPSREVREAPGARPFVVVFMTDGRGNREAPEILNRLVDSGHTAANVRLFPFGVGHDVNTVLLDGLAETFTGRPRYVQPGENLELVLGDFFSVISRPVLTNLRLTLPEIGATERFPAALGDLYHGQQITLAGRFREPGAGTVKLVATRGGKTVEYAWPNVAFTSTDGADYVDTVWAGRKIAYLVDQIRTHGESDEMIKEILALSQEHGIQTPYSSWLVDPERLGTPPPLVPMPPIRTGAAFNVGGAAEGAPTAASQRLVADRIGKAAGGGGSLFGDPGDESEAPAAYGDDFGELDLELARRSVTESYGRAANVIARKNAELKKSRGRDRDRLDVGALAYRKIGDRWYNRMGRYLVDERVSEKTEFVVVRFASDAYFELVRRHAHLRAVLAASPTVVVIVDDDTAIVVSERAGIETLDEDQRRKLLD